MQPLKRTRRTKAIAFTALTGLFAAGVTALAPGVAFAAQRDWDGSTSGAWTTVTNWVADTPPNPVGGDDAVFPGGAIPNRTISGIPVIELEGITFNNSDADGVYDIQANGTNAITFFNAGGDAFADSIGTANGNIVRPPIVLEDNLLSFVGLGGQLVLAGNISEAGGARALVKGGNGTLELRSANNYSGPTGVAGGTLRITNSTALGTTAAGTDVVGTLEYAGPLNVAEPLFMGGTLRASKGGATGTVPVIQSGVVTLVLSSSVVVDSEVVLTISQPIPAGGAGITKGGGGTLVLPAANLYTGDTVVNGGTVLVTGSLAGPTLVQGGTLAGNGTVQLVVAETGTVAPGDGTAGTFAVLTTGEFDLRAGAKLLIDLTGQSPGVNQDQVRVTGQTKLAGNLEVVGTPGLGTEFVIIDNDTAADAVVGTFAGLAEGATVTSTTGAQFVITYKGGDGNDVSLLPLASLVRVAGADRIETSVKISQATYPTGGTADAVVLARAEEFPDALSGTPLAVFRNAPLLLTNTATLDPRVATEITRVLGAGNTSKVVYILGGTAAISTAVEDAVRALGFQIVRYAGVDRYDTSVVIARDGLQNPPRLLMATGNDFADAISAGAAAAYDDNPNDGPLPLFPDVSKPQSAVLLTNDSVLPPTVQSYVSGRGTGVGLFAIGGPASRAVPNATPVVGVDRYDTSVKTALTFFAGFSPPFSGPQVIGLASGVAFPDGLAGGAHIARDPRDGPLLLTKPDVLPEVVRSFLVTRSDFIIGGFVYGGPAAVSDAVFTAANNAIRGV